MKGTPAPGRRIAVVGTSGAGKTHVAQALAAILSIPYICNDAIIWRPRWQETPRAERINAIDAATGAGAWTFDGNLAARNPDDKIVLKRCDTIVWLDLPRREVWSQVLWRTLKRVITREELWHGNRESLRMMLSRDSILLYSVKTFSRRRAAYEMLFQDPELATKALIRLRSRREVEAWLKSVPAAISGL
jgi:adenylate kinase family enzyme